MSYQQIRVTPRPLLLASASPRRREILERAGVPIVVRSVAVDETRPAGEPTSEYLDRVTRAKLLATAREHMSVDNFSGVLSADTIVEIDGQVLGKPANDEEGREMLRLLSGKTHEVRTRFCLGEASAELAIVHAETVTTLVTFRSLDAGEIARYVRSGEGADKAGGYAIQGVGAFLTSGIRGSYANVVGLPITEVILALVAARFLEAYPLVDEQDR